MRRRRGPDRSQPTEPSPSMHQAPSFGRVVQGWWIGWPWPFPSGTDQGQLLGRESGSHEPRLGHPSEGYDVRETRNPDELGIHH